MRAAQRRTRREQGGERERMNSQLTGGVTGSVAACNDRAPDTGTHDEFPQ